MKNNENVFIVKANLIHEHFYDYTKVEYKNNKTKIIIICPIHGEFMTTPERHLLGVGCPICSGYRMNTVEFIKKANIVHKNCYDYSKVDYKNNKTKIKIICHKHGEFEQTSTMHLNGQGCPKCANELKGIKRKFTNNMFIKKAIVVHGNKYDYSLVNYIHSQIKVKIICHKHGVFEQKPNQHLIGHNCPKCGKDIASNSKRKTTKEFIEKAIMVHHNKYDYSMVNYIGSINKITIICPRHGKFEQNAANHLMGQGCPICNESKGENEIRRILNEFNVNYIQQKMFNDCIGKINKLPFDFYLPDKNVLIEYNGEQHYKAIKYFGGNKTFNRIKKCDDIKKEFAQENKIKLIEISYNNFKEIKTILKNENIF